MRDHSADVTLGNIHYWVALLLVTSLGYVRPMFLITEFKETGASEGLVKE